MNLHCTPLSPTFGAQLKAGTQLVDFDDTAVDALKLLAAERGVVVARNQNMDVDSQVRFAKRLGELFTTPLNKGALPAELIRIKADASSKRVAGQTWHSDVSSEAAPPGLSMLRMEVVPDSGGDTLFADMYQAYETLSVQMQQFVEQLTARHVPRGHYLYLSGAKRLDELPASEHPVVRTHPLTGRKALYINAGFVDKIVELNRRESDALLTLLYDHIAYAVSTHIRVAWQPNTVVFWDNRVVQHHAAFDYHPQERLGYRATVRGEAPYLESAET
ncbi:MAG: TauD/TfdA family dioxygenase [Pseudomonadota bacterium]